MRLRPPPPPVSSDLVTLATALDDDTFERLFPAFVDVYPGYANYLERREGLHPRMFRLSPVA